MVVEKYFVVRVLFFNLPVSQCHGVTVTPPLGPLGPSTNFAVLTCTARISAGRRAVGSCLTNTPCRKATAHTDSNDRVFFFNLYAFILLTSTLVPGINYFAVTTHPLHQLQVRKRRSSSCYMIETYNTRHRFPCY